jgi:hypothetical protein
VPLAHRFPGAERFYTTMLSLSLSPPAMIADPVYHRIWLAAILDLLFFGLHQQHSLHSLLTSPAPSRLKIPAINFPNSL